jgi:acyl carrier protein
MMEIGTFIKQFAESVDDVEMDKIKADTIFKEIPQWDSLALLNIIAMIDTEYDVSLSGDEIKNCASIEQLFLKVKEKKEGL